MDRIDELTAIVRREVADYVCPSPNSTAYYVEDPEQQVYAVLVVPNLEPDERFRKSSVMIIARIVDDKVVIEADSTNKPLYEALINANVPQSQIILAYAGETEPMA